MTRRRNVPRRGTWEVAVLPDPLNPERDILFVVGVDGGPRLGPLWVRVSDVRKRLGRILRGEEPGTSGARPACVRCEGNFEDLVRGALDDRKVRVEVVERFQVVDAVVREALEALQAWSAQPAEDARRWGVLLERLESMLLLHHAHSTVAWSFPEAPEPLGRMRVRAGAQDVMSCVFLFLEPKAGDVHRDAPGRRFWAVTFMPAPLHAPLRSRWAERGLERHEHLLFAMKSVSEPWDREEAEACWRAVTAFLEALEARYHHALMGPTLTRTSSGTVVASRPVAIRCAANPLLVRLPGVEGVSLVVEPEPTLRIDLRPGASLHPVLAMLEGELLGTVHAQQAVLGVGAEDDVVLLAVFPRADLRVAPWRDLGALAIELRRRDRRGRPRVVRRLRKPIEGGMPSWLGLLAELPAGPYPGWLAQQLRKDRDPEATLSLYAWPLALLLPEVPVASVLDLAERAWGAAPNGVDAVREAVGGHPALADMDPQDAEDLLGALVERHELVMTLARETGAAPRLPESPVRAIGGRLLAEVVRSASWSPEA